MNFINIKLILSLFAILAFGCEQTNQMHSSTFEELQKDSLLLDSDLVLKMLDSNVQERLHCPVFIQNLETGSGMESCVVLGIHGWVENSGIVLAGGGFEALLRSKVNNERQLWVEVSGTVQRNKAFDEYAQIGAVNTALGFLVAVELHGWSYGRRPEVIPSLIRKGRE